MYLRVCGYILIRNISKLIRILFLKNDFCQISDKKGGKKEVIGREKNVIAFYASLRGTKTSLRGTKQSFEKFKDCFVPRNDGGYRNDVGYRNDGKKLLINLFNILLNSHGHTWSYRRWGRDIQDQIMFQ